MTTKLESAKLVAEIGKLVLEIWEMIKARKQANEAKKIKALEVQIAELKKRLDGME